jgi:hypothetical protein
MTKVIEDRVGRIMEAAGHHSPGVECGGSGGFLLMRHLLSRGLGSTGKPGNAVEQPLSSAARQQSSLFIVASGGDWRMKCLGRHG